MKKDEWVQQGCIVNWSRGDLDEMIIILIQSYSSFLWCRTAYFFSFFFIILSLNDVCIVCRTKKKILNKRNAEIKYTQRAGRRENNKEEYMNVIGCYTYKTQYFFAFPVNYFLVFLFHVALSENCVVLCYLYW